MIVSIIIPAFNETATIAATLRVLQPLREHGHEVIVVDGGSRDGTPRVAAPFADRVLVAPRGRARQMNAGAAVATGAVLWFLHADTLAPADATEQIALARARGYGWGRFDVRLTGRKRLLRVVAWAMNRRSCLSGIATGDQGLFVNRLLFEALGGYPDQPLMEDVELSRRLKRRGRPACLPGPLVTSARRWERDGVWSTIVLMWRLRLAYFCGADARTLQRRYERGESPPRRQNRL
ncbi:TIGR04283 family arsenosugar biosynthesis glycosyltransferase [Nitrococcus mobilis]|uniref:Glycosyltransferase involved in cell wall biogenesis n=1 Tax=Nitrococcus mobilis Nb-231 TaxID=314278 RepID=A4BPW3_9GAMM|nr:TIGR04283 family arsenosugar biosynthesis glycosyltransferase [Nitrococcus mobilis]EAR22118.1 Glycosyltransferase involved in cell wall biogenesis [Nitrococcus mobilis Nb-231]